MQSDYDIVCPIHSFAELLTNAKQNPAKPYRYALNPVLNLLSGAFVIFCDQYLVLFLSLPILGIIHHSS